MPKLGKFRKIFLNASAPGGDGYDSSLYTQFLLVTSITFGSTRATHNIATMDDVFESVFLAGRREQTITIEGLFNQTGDTGQEIGETAHLGDTQAASKTWWLWTTDVTADKERKGTGVIQTFTIASPDEGPETVSMTIQVNTVDTAIQDVP